MLELSFLILIAVLAGWAYHLWNKDYPIPEHLDRDKPPKTKAEWEAEQYRRDPDWKVKRNKRHDHPQF